MIGSLFDQTVSVKRLADGDGNKIAYGDHIDSLSCNIQPVDDKLNADKQGSFGKNWLLMCDPADIQEGDQVVWGSKTYKVTAIDTLSFMGEEHAEVIMRIFES